MSAAGECRRAKKTGTYTGKRQSPGLHWPAAEPHIDAVGSKALGNTDRGQSTHSHKWAEDHMLTATGSREQSSRQAVLPHLVGRSC